LVLEVLFLPLIKTLR